MDLASFLVSLFVVADDCWQWAHPPAPRKPGRPPSLLPSEALTLAILSQWPRFRSERDFFRYAHAHLREYIPHPLSHGQLNRRIRALEPEVRSFQRDLASTLADGSEVYHILDTNPSHGPRYTYRSYAWHRVAARDVWVRIPLEPPYTRDVARENEGRGN